MTGTWRSDENDDQVFNARHVPLAAISEVRVEMTNENLRGQYRWTKGKIRVRVSGRSEDILIPSIDVHQPDTPPVYDNNDDAVGALLQVAEALTRRINQLPASH